MHIFYLHGFASSAKSTKAGFFAARLRAHGITLHTPDLNQPDFTTLTVSRMVDQVTQAIVAVPEGGVTLIGSSLGGFVAVQTAVQGSEDLGPGNPENRRHPGTERNRKHPIERMVLLAPALEFLGNRTRDLGDRGLEEWQASGHLDVFHYGYGRRLPVHYGLYTDACGYDCVNAALPMPIQVFQGRNDTAVDPHSVEQWARARSNVELHLLDDDHQLTASLEHIWSEMSRFLGLARRY
ncbi:MAG: alpha/beta fold hydrolase [Acidobacteria bacterium]|nr:alpha/beta fold hydrolase [Acidobacteriota bacterium]